jgi:hypothetical protein
MINNNEEIKRARGPNKLYYNYKLKLDDNEEYEYYKSCKEITDKYGISRSNIYLMVKYPETERRKYNNFRIEKIHKHYLTIDANVPEHQIIA